MWKFSIPFVVCAAGIAAPARASTGGWDWEEDFMPDHWGAASLVWARTIHPMHPSTDNLLARFEPPPDEPWCHEPPAPVLGDCDIHDDLLDEWLHYYLNIPYDQPLPANLAPYPYECPSVCSG